MNLAQTDIDLAVDSDDPQALIDRTKIMLRMNMPYELAVMGVRLARCQHPEAPYWHDHILTRFYNQAVTPDNINIGGGPNFHYPGWRNFDSAESPLNPWPVKFAPDTMFPVKAGTARMVYSSHCLEHLNDQTVDMVLMEARRMLRPDGALVLKLPDFDEVLRRWKAGDNEYFKQWGIDKVVKTWASRGVDDTIDARAAMIFCGWWNDAYGDEFGERKPDAEGAYHGPIVAEKWFYGEVLANGTPHEIADKFKCYLYQAIGPQHFNHQNAWSVEELGELLAKHDFSVISTDKAEIQERLQIPGIRDMASISMYVLAQ